MVIFTQYIVFSSEAIVKESAVQASTKMLRVLQEVMERKINVARDSIFRLYEDEEKLNTVIDLSEDTDKSIYDIAKNSNSILNTMKYLVSGDSKISATFIYNYSSQKLYIFNRKRNTFEQHTSLNTNRRRINWMKYEDTIIPTNDIDYPYDNEEYKVFGLSFNIIIPGTNKVPGKIAIDFKLDDFVKAYDNYKDNFMGYILILTRDGDVIFDSTGKYYGAKYLYYNVIKEGRQEALLEEESIINAQDFNQDTLRYVAIIPKSSVYGDMNVLRNSNFVVVLLILLVVFSTYFAVTSIINKNINKIIAVVNRTEGSNLSTRIHFKNDNHEFGRIAKHINNMYDRLQDHINKTYIYELKQKNAELRRLQAQVNPHFLYNSLETIRVTADKNGDSEAGEMISALARLFRASIKSGMVVTIGDELEYCKMYLKLFTARYEDFFTYHIEVDPEICEFGIVKNTLQPLLENYVVHAFDRMKTDNWIRLKGGVKDKTVYLRLDDNGVGIELDKLEKIQSRLQIVETTEGGSIGLSNVNERLKLLFGNQYGITIDSVKDKGTTLIITFPQKTKEQVEYIIGL